MKYDKFSTVIATIVLISAFVFGEVAAVDLMHKATDTPNLTLWMTFTGIVGPAIALSLMTLLIKVLEAFSKLLRRPE